MIKEKIDNMLPDEFKPIIKTFYKGLSYPYSSLKRFKIKRIQEKLLIQNYYPDIKKLIIFLTPGYDIVNGGILAISSTYNETKKLKHIHGAEVIMCSLPGDPLLLRYTKFNFQDYIYDFSQVLSYFKDLQSLMIHIPVVYIPQFLINLPSKEYSKLREIKNLHINIMLMNIRNLPSTEYFKELKKLKLEKLTATTAHESYSTYDVRKKLGFPLHKLSTYVSPEFYERKGYTKKKDLLIVSPDFHPKKSEILNLIRKRFPQLKIEIIENIPYEEYKKLISDAKWAITFGEGLDGYFVETIFSGGISFATYNSDFFTEDFKNLRTVYDNYDEMAIKICEDMKSLDNETSYTDYQNKQFELVSKYYNYKNYLKNLELFYREVYTYP
jgi:hypothetical protein